MSPEAFRDRSETDPGCRAERLRSREEGVRRDDDLPFLVGPADAETAVLMVHGFTATPWEMRLVGEFLAADGMSCLAVRLPGHGTTPEDLADRHWQDWLQAVCRGRELLTERHAHIFGLGMSTGCLVLLACALEKAFDGLVLCSPYLRVQNRLAAYARWLRWLHPYHARKTAATNPHYYDRRPVAGVHQINRLIAHLRPRLAECRAPVLGLNGEGDQTIEIESAAELLRQLGSAVRIHYCYGGAVPHVMVREENPVRREMFALIRAFIRETVKPGEVRRPADDRGR